jgi:hypothetical protein
MSGRGQVLPLIGVQDVQDVIDQDGLRVRPTERSIQNPFVEPGLVEGCPKFARSDLPDVSHEASSHGSSLCVGACGVPRHPA